LLQHDPAFLNKVTDQFANEWPADPWEILHTWWTQRRQSRHGARLGLSGPAADHGQQGWRL